MRKIRLIFHFLFLLMLTDLQSQNGESPFPADDRGCHEPEHTSHFVMTDRFRNYAADETDVHYQDMHVVLDPAVNHVEGVITFYFHSRQNNINRLVLDYTDTLPVQYVRRGNQDLSFTQSDDLLTIDLGKSLSQGQSDTVTVSFSSDGTLYQKMHNGVPVISTDANLLVLWYPGKRDLIDKIDSVDIYVTTPAGMLAAGNGKLVSITEDNGQLIHHWKHRHPIATTYLLEIAVTNYVAVEDSMILPGGDTMELLHYLYPENLSTVLPEVAATSDIMNFYIDHFGPYPFDDEKYGHAQYTAGGALEVQTMPFMGFFDFGVIAHEMAHQWFGNYVTCGSLSDMWLNEGMAEYLEGLSIEHFRPNDWKGLKNSKISSVTSEPGGSTFIEDTTDVNSIFNGRLTYNKGFYIAHMLRWLVGDSLFFEACRNYLHDPEHADGFARTNDFQNHFEAVSGLDLDGYFADWFYGEGYPSYTVDWTIEQDSLILWVQQIQSHPSVSYFEMPLPVQAYHFGIVGDFVLNNTENHQRFAFYVGNTLISQILIDPDKWILSKNNKSNHIITGIHDPYPVTDCRLYPNPASGYFEVESNVDLRVARLTNTQGISFPFETNNHQVSTAQLPPGYYYVWLEDKRSGLLSTRPLAIIR